MDEPNRARRLVTEITAAGLCGGVPVALVTRIRVLHSNIPLAVLATVLYEIALAAIGFTLAVSSDLRARWVSRAAESIDSWLRRKASRFTREYLRYVRAFTRYMDTRGLSTAGPHILEMADVLVTLSLSSKPLHTLSSDPVRRHIEQDASASENIWHWLREAKKDGAILSIIGPPGSGKTTLLRHVAFTLAKGGRYASKRGAFSRIPILVNLREHTFPTSLTSLSLADLLRQSLVALDRPEPPSWIETNLKHGKFAILLDGLDEISQQGSRMALVDWLGHQSSAQNGNLFILTSRPFGYRENPIGSAIVVEVQALAERQISSFVNQWYKAISIRSHGADNESSQLAAKRGSADLLARLDQTPSLFELTANPLLLTMLVNVHYYHVGALPGSRAELYDEICDVFLAKRDQSRGIRVDIPGPQKRAGLRALAYEMTSREVVEVKANDASSWIAPVLDKMPKKIEPLEFLRNIEDSAGLLVEKERGVYSFAHRTFQEYLTAEFIQETGRVNEIVSKITSLWWRETVRLYSAISDDATPVVEGCLKYRTDPELIVLGVQCADEANALDKEARRAIDECINPRDARDDIAARHMAARVRLQLRASRDISLKKSSFIGGMHVTWLEYQYFIDSFKDVECLVPDHWSDGIYPAEMDCEPVIGLRYTDAERFCEWLGSELQPSFRVRLPRTSEIDRAFEFSGNETNLKSLAYWTTTQLPRSRDGRFWPLLRDPRAGARRDAYPLLDQAITRQEVDSLIEADLRRLRSAAVESKSFSYTTPLTLSNSSVVLSPNASPLSGLLDRCAADSPACDAGQVQRDIQLARTLVRYYVESHRLSGNASDMQDRLMKLGDELHEISVVALDRKSYSSRVGEHMAQLRHLAQMTALEAAVLCIMLHMEHGGSNPLPPLEEVIRPSRKVPNPSRLPTVAMNILAHAFMGTYIDFLVLSARISMRAAPTESLIYVREAHDDRNEIQGIISRIYPALMPARMSFIKRLVDVAFSLLFLAVLAPVFAVLGIAIRLSDGGPVLFSQTRVGKDGRNFRIYKFRTMVVNAEQLLDELTVGNERDGVLFKIRRDPRITPIGIRLRRWSMDELPQLLNVLRGDMSLVGPRAALPEETAMYSEEVSRRLVVKPGLTGLWQVNGRSDLSWEESVRLDLRYVENWSLALDSQILWKTFSVILRGSGAY